MSIIIITILIIIIIITAAATTTSTTTKDLGCATGIDGLKEDGVAAPAPAARAVWP